MNRHLSAEFWLVLNVIWVAPVTAKLSSKIVMKAKQKQLRRHGLGNRLKATTALTDDEIEILFDKKLLGLSSPQALLNTVWVNNMIHFGRRGCKEQKELRWGDIVLKTDTDGKEYLEYFERQTKTRTGEDPRNQRPIKPRMYYANNDAVSVDRNPVHVYKMYKEKRPPSMLEPDSSFYLSVNYFKTETHASVEGKNWFKAQPMGVNKLNNIMKDMPQAAGISGKTNHSGRKTLVQKLQDSGVPPNQIIQITGHKNLQSVNNYSSLREMQMGVFPVFFPREPKPLPTSHRPKTTWQRNPWLSIESLQRLPLHLPWMGIPSMRIGSKRCFTENT